MEEYRLSLSVKPEEQRGRVASGDFTIGGVRGVCIMQSDRSPESSLSCTDGSGEIGRTFRCFSSETGSLTTYLGMSEITFSILETFYFRSNMA